MLSVMCALPVTAILAACASPSGGWHQPVKNEALTRADYAACRSGAEESTIELRKNGQRGYDVLADNSPGVFNPRGDSPMAIAERSDTSALFNALVANCMTAKGYRQTK